MKQVDECSYCDGSNFYYNPEESIYICEDCGNYFTGYEDDDEGEIDEDA
jgi:ribosomal protein L37AE/L43A